MTRCSIFKRRADERGQEEMQRDFEGAPALVSGWEGMVASVREAGPFDVF